MEQQYGKIYGVSKVRSAKTPIDTVAEHSTRHKIVSIQILRNRFFVKIQGGSFKFAGYLKQITSAYNETTETCNMGIERKFC